MLISVIIAGLISLPECECAEGRGYDCLFHYSVSSSCIGSAVNICCMDGWMLCCLPSSSVLFKYFRTSLMYCWRNALGLRYPSMRLFGYLLQNS